MGRAARAKRERDRTERAELDWCGEMCSSCAYRPGTEANREQGDPGLTRKRRILLDACEPFFCHDLPPAHLRGVRGAERKKLCIGHMRMMERLTREGFYAAVSDDEMMARKRAAVLAVRAIDRTRAIVDAVVERRAAAARRRRP